MTHHIHQIIQSAPNYNKFSTEQKMSYMHIPGTVTFPSKCIGCTGQNDSMSVG